MKSTKLDIPNWTVPNLGLVSGIDQGRFNDRRDLLSNLNLGVAAERNSTAYALNQLSTQAADLLTDPKKQRAFRLNDEPDSIRDNGARDRDAALSQDILYNSSMDIRQSKVSPLYLIVQFFMVDS